MVRCINLHNPLLTKGERIVTVSESSGCAAGLRVAVVTPYFKESPATLQRCLTSVRAQTYPQVVHYLVADGFPQNALLTQWPGVRHIQLPNGHANFGCTPRGVGAQCALADGFDVVCFLDADNLIEPEHVATVVETVAKAQAAGVALDAVFSLRYLFLPGHEHLRLVAPREDVGSGFVDTSCISLTRSAGFLWGAWCQIPSSLTPICDRVMCWLMQHHRLKVAWTGQRTVLYESSWAHTYVQAGVPVPASGTHDHTLRAVGQGLTPEELWARLRVRWTFGRPIDGAAS